MERSFGDRHPFLSFFDSGAVERGRSGLSDISNRQQTGSRARPSDPWAAIAKLTGGPAVEDVTPPFSSGKEYGPMNLTSSYSGLSGRIWSSIIFFFHQTTATPAWEATLASPPRKRSGSIILLVGRLVGWMVGFAGITRILNAAQRSSAVYETPIPILRSSGNSTDLNTRKTSPDFSSRKISPEITARKISPTSGKISLGALK